MMLKRGGIFFVDQVTGTPTLFPACVERSQFARLNPHTGFFRGHAQSLGVLRGRHLAFSHKKTSSAL
jgi:hypothetical protein